MQLSIQGISKTYPNGVRAIDDIHLEIKAGMFGLLGPNGAGKSSLMRTIATLQAPDSGTVLFQGKNIFEDKTTFRKSLGYLPQEFGVYPKETAVSLLDYFGVLKGIASKTERRNAIERVLALTNLTDVRNKRVSTYSGGMRQRFGIAQLLLNNPSVIIVDEPTAGLDPSERTRFLNVLRTVGNENIVIFSTHLVEDVKELCHEMAIVDKGKIRVKTSPKKATDGLRGMIWEAPESESTVKQADTILSKRFNEDNQTLIRVYAKNQPSPEFTSVNAKLEDFYFLTLNQ